jgi:GNAT superfamily N-acetyltransferase
VSRPEVVIREAVPADAPTIARVHVESWRTTYAGLMPAAVIASQTVARREASWSQQIEAVLSEPVRGVILVADHPKAGVVGFGSAGREREQDAGFDAELYTLYLLEEHQSRGLGRRLLRRTAAELSRHGHRSMRVWVLAGNPAEAFYARMGGVRAGEKHEDVAGHTLTEVAYVWHDLTTLAA